MTTVVFRSCAPTQSWGAVGNGGDSRPTSTHPIQSSVTGLICAALGVGRDDLDAIAGVNAAVMAFRMDRQGVIAADYQTVSDTISADLQPRGTILTSRGELQDACITIFCAWGDAHLARAVHGALRRPHWPLFLGRRCHAVGSFPDAALIDRDLDDDLIGSWEACPIHPATGETWTVVEDTTAPLNAEGVTMTGSRASDFRSRNHTMAPVRRRTLPRLVAADTGFGDEQALFTLDRHGVLIVEGDRT